MIREGWITSCDETYLEKEKKSLQNLVTLKFNYTKVSREIFYAKLIEIKIGDKLQINSVFLILIGDRNACQDSQK